jgi:hypothetical protein
MPWSPVWPASDCKGYPLSFLLCIGTLITVQRHLFIMQVLLSMLSFHRSSLKLECSCQFLMNTCVYCHWNMKLLFTHCRFQVM